MGSPAFLVRLRPRGAWRPGAPGGTGSRVPSSFGSDSLFSALTCAFAQLDLASAWIEATAQTSTPAVRLSSAFPFTGRTLLLPAPRNAWPPASPGRVRWKAAKYIPMSLVATVLRDELPSEERWTVDPISECLLPVEKNGVFTEPFRVNLRLSAAVDRLSGQSSAARSTACLEWNTGCGLWFLTVFESDTAKSAWGDRLRSAFRLLADTGLGGRRSAGWGQIESVDVEEASFPEMISLPRSSPGETGYWLLSLFHPGESDRIDWTGGAYKLINRGKAGTAPQKLVEEGGVLLGSSEPVGQAMSVSSGNGTAPTFRNGFALAVPVPYRAPSTFFKIVPPKEVVEPTEPEPHPSASITGQPDLDETPAEPIEPEQTEDFEPRASESITGQPDPTETPAEPIEPEQTEDSEPRASESITGQFDPSDPSPEGPGTADPSPELDLPNDTDPDQPAPDSAPETEPGPESPGKPAPEDEPL